MLATIRMVGVAVIVSATAAVYGEPPDAPPLTSNSVIPLDLQSPQEDDEVVEQKPVDAQAPNLSSQEARAALAKGDGKRALSLVESETTQLPQAERLSIAGQAHFLLGNTAEARRKLEAALKQRPNNAPDLYWLGRVHATSGMPVLAMSRYEEASWNGLETADLHYHWALALKSANQLLGKVTQLPPEKKAAKSPTPGTLTSKGLIVGPVSSRPGWSILSPKNSAIYQAHQAVELDPKRADARLLCAEIWAAVNRHEEAAAAFKKAADGLEKEDLVQCREGWAKSLLATGDLDGYLEQTKLRLTSGKGAYLTELARSHDVAAKEAAKRGDLKQQIRYLTKAVELDATDVDRLISLADALSQTQKEEDAARHLRAALQCNPTSDQKKAINERLQKTTLRRPTAEN